MGKGSGQGGGQGGGRGRATSSVPPLTCLCVVCGCGACVLPRLPQRTARESRRVPDGRGHAVNQGVNEAVPGLGSAPPWDFRLRPRGGLAQDGKTMVPFRRAPWKDPQQMDSSGRLTKGNPPEFFTRYLRLTKLDKPAAASLSSMGGPASTNFVQCEANPGVALDKSNHKYRLLMIENGNAKTVGRFHVEREGIEGYNAYIDMQTKGPLGVPGVPSSIGNMGPPGVALLPKMDWQMNTRNRPPIDEGNYDAYADQEVQLAKRRFQQQRLGSEPARHEEELATNVTQQKGPHALVATVRKSLSDLPGNLDSLAPSGSKTHRLRGIYDDRGLTLASCMGSPRNALSSTSDVRKSLAFTMATPNRPLSFRNVPFRPATSLLKDKGQWTGKPPAHAKQGLRPDLPSVA